MIYGPFVHISSNTLHQRKPVHVGLIIRELDRMSQQPRATPTRQALISNIRP